MSASAANKLARTLLVLFFIQLTIGIVLAFSWPVALKAPGPLVGAAFTLVFRTLLKRGWLRPKRAMSATVLVLVVGMLYPWPWVRDAEEVVDKTATVRRLVAPEGCVCVAIAVDHLWGPKDTYGGHADAFCVPESDQRLSSWIEAGTVSAQWRLTLRTQWFNETTLYATGLNSVDGVLSGELYANNGCENVMP